MNVKKKRGQAYKKNVQIVYNLSKICKINKIKFIHISTDHLFEGKNLFYKEIDKPKPLNTYAKTKFLAEKIIKKKLNNYIIIRSNFFGWDKKGSKKFFSWLIDNLNAKKNIKLYSDVFFTPVSSYFLSLVYVDIIKKFNDELYLKLRRTDLYRNQDFSKSHKKIAKVIKYGL